MCDPARLTYAWDFTGLKPKEVICQRTTVTDTALKINCGRGPVMSVGGLAADEVLLFWGGDHVKPNECDVLRQDERTI